MPEVKTRSRVAAVVAQLACLLALNILITLFHWGSYQKPLLVFQPSFEVIGIYLVVAAISIWAGPKSRIWLRVVGIVVALLMMYGVGEVFNRFFYERNFTPWTDLHFAPTLVAMTMGSTPTAEKIAYVILAAAVAVIVVISLLLVRGLSVSVLRARMSSLAMLVVIPLGIAIGFAPSLSVVIGQHILPPKPVSIESGADSIAKIANEQISFPFLKRRNVYLFVFESYGSTLYLDKNHEPMTRAFFAGIEQRLTGAGYSIYSNFLDSPTTGGRSWLAESTLLTGIRVTTDEIYDSIVQGGTRADLPYLFERAGYHTVLAAPANLPIKGKLADYLHYDTYLSHDAYDYRGPNFPWGYMPDQFFLNTVRKKLSSLGSPFFTELVTVSSHAPFDLVPQYVPDWDSLRDGSEFYALHNPHFENRWLTGTQYLEGYIAGVEYTFNVIADYLTKYINDDSVIIIVGDHQPRYPVREDGENTAVPMHILSRDPAMTAAFAKYGFVPGIVPKAAPKIMGMEKFFPMFISTAEGSGN